METIRKRCISCRLIEKMEREPSYSRMLGLTNSSIIKHIKAYKPTTDREENHKRTDKS